MHVENVSMIHLSFSEMSEEGVKSQELELQAVHNYLMLVPGTEFGPSEKVVSALNS